MHKTILKHSQQNLFMIIAISVFLRVIAAFAMGDTVVELPGIFDQISYHNLALRVANGYGFSFGELWWPITPADAPTAHWSFLYTLYLTFVYELFGPHPIIARILQAILVGILHPCLAYQIGKKNFNETIGLIAALITAVYIYFIYYGAALMTEPIYITAILFSLYFALQLSESRDRKQDVKLGIALGCSIGIALLLRQVFLLFLPFLFLWTWISRFRQGRGLPFGSTALTLALIICFIAPATFYNYSRFGRFILLNTNSGYAFFWGNNPIYGTKFIPILSTEEYRAMIPEEIRHLDEAALDQELLKRGVQFMLDDPQRYLLLSLSRIPPYFMFWYSSESSLLSNVSRIGSFGVFLPFMVYGVLLRIRKYERFWNFILSGEGLLMLFVTVYSGIHILTWTLIRYRLPVDAVLIPFAALALMDVAARLVKNQHRLVTE
jgi:4-amino-4-deoxy-L-arabinose transferase-like glycosyltransferase